MPDYRAEDLHPDLVAAIQTLAARPQELLPIGTLPSPEGNRGAFLVRLADGRRVKATLLESRPRAREVVAILALLRNRHLTRVLAHHGRALVTEWVEGAWPDRPDRALFEDCGAILGSIHAVRVPAGLPVASCRYGHGWSAALAAQLDEIVSYGELDNATARAALGLAEGSAPASGDSGFVHRDFCSDNLVVGTDGLVHAIDNETVACDALDYDLARWWYRWPMSDAARESFLAGYARYRSSAAFQYHFAFWMVLALVDSALFRLQAGTGHVAVPIERLKALVRDGETKGAGAPAAAGGNRGGRIFFASDLHLGAPGELTSIDRERQVVAWLDLVQREASDLFLLGDLFDFWFEYKTVVPRGHTRVLGRLAALSDAGVQLHVFTGNHDLWLGDYLERELRARIYREPRVMRLNGRTMYLGHGDVDGRRSLRDRVGGSRLIQQVFAGLHPDVGIAIARAVASRSRAVKSRFVRGRPSRATSPAASLPNGPAPDPDEALKAQALRIRAIHPEVDFIVLGHRHRPALVQLDERAWCVDVGDWLSHRSYVSFDGTKLELREFRSR